VALTPCDPALEAYEALAPYYDRYTAGYDHEHWVGAIEAIARELGVGGTRLLDVGCGTGKSFLPMLRLGWSVVGCDLSPAMADAARQAAGGHAEVLVADVRELPQLGAFDLVTAIDDALNYLLSEEELLAAFEGIARNLRPGGIFAFDLNTLATYRGLFTCDEALDVQDAFMCWRGEGDPNAAPGCLSSSTVEVFSTVDGDSWQRTRSHHLQRHHPPELVERLLRQAGLEPVDRRGHLPGAGLEAAADDHRHAKLVWFARPAGSSEQGHEGGGEMIVRF
jgi:SAM-dependent methyltransferase